MKQELVVLAWLIFGLFTLALGFLIWAAVGARGRGATLAGAGLLPHFLLLGAGLLGAVNMATGYSPAELSYTILIVQAVMIIVALTRLWRFLKRHLRDVDLSGRSGND